MKITLKIYYFLGLWANETFKTFINAIVQVIYFLSFVQEISDRKQIIVEKFQKEKLVRFYFLLLSGFLLFVRIAPLVAFDWICFYLQMGIHHSGRLAPPFVYWQLFIERRCVQIFDS